MRPHRFRSVVSAAALSCVLALGGCSGSFTDGQDSANNDPYESFNRKVWDVDLALNDYLLTPVARGYRWATPDVVQTAVANALRNLKSPAVLANDILQGNSKRAGQTLTRIWLNTLVGLGGLIDVATDQNLPFHDTDFGATLGSWGVPSGPFLVLPLLGPSDPRDGSGTGVDSFLFDPFSIKMNAAGIQSANYYRFGVGTVSDGASRLDELDELRKSSLDFYAAVRSLYQQKRAADIATAKNPNAPSVPNVRYDEVEPSSPTPSAPAAGSGTGKVELAKMVLLGIRAFTLHTKQT
jgi:phospholipid-binding lipoprotein MlaA